MPRLFTSILQAELVIADITYQNPNVYYELGLRHALKPQGTLLIRHVGGDFAVQSIKTRKRGASNETAFDIKGVTIYSYKIFNENLTFAISDLAHQIKRVSSSVEPDSPAFLYLQGLKVITGSPSAYARNDQLYNVLDNNGKETRCFVGYRSGDIKELHGDRSIDF
ncbi:MAG: hypothetical protein WBP46_03235 [Thiolinea sp.]